MRSISFSILGTLVVVLALATLGLSAINTEQAGNSTEVNAETSFFSGVSGPVEQGDMGFWHAPYVLVSSTGVSGPVEQGDAGFYHSPYVMPSSAGISGPVEQGDVGFWHTPYIPVGSTGVSGPVEQVSG